MPKYPYRSLGSFFDRLFRNNLNDNFSDIQSDLEEQKGRVDNLITGTPQPSEVVDARGGFSVLRDRLNSVDTSLAQIATNIQSFPIQAPEVDDTARIRRAIAGTPDNGILYLPEINGWYNISDTIVVNRNIDFICKGKIKYSGTRDRIALQFIGMTMRKIEVYQLYDQNSVVNSYDGWHGWVNDSYTGIEFNNIKQCLIKIEDVRNFSTGVRAKASGGNGFWFNHLDIRQISNCRIFLEINSDGANSWLNGNYFYDTSFYYGLSGTNYATDSRQRYSILQTMTNGNNYGGNANYFYRQKFEVNTGYTGGMWTQVYLIKASAWLFRDYRVELSGSSVTFANIDLTNTDTGLTTLGAHSNGIRFYPAGTGGSVNLTNTQNINGNYSDVVWVEDTKRYLVHREADLKHRYRKYQASYHTIKGLVRKPSGSTSLTEEYSYDYSASDLRTDTGVTITSSYSVVVYITNLSKGDKITIEKLNPSGSIPSNLYKVFDTTDTFCANGLINGGKALAYQGLFDTNTNSLKQYTATTEDSFTINDANVKTVAILITGTINGFNIYSTNINNVVKRTMNPTKYSRDGFYVRSIPSTALDGYFMPLEVVYNDNNTTGNAIGWQLGTNLTWSSVGTY